VKPLTLIGLLLIGLGAFVLVNGFSFTSNRQVLKVGSLEASVKEERAVPAWVGGVALLLGLGLVATAGRRRT
jgi:hypothetical protein